MKIALKEWSVAIRAMEMGQQDVIFRKGGIAEPEGDFRLTHDQFLLYPAREHQKSHLLKPGYLPLLQQVKEAQQGHHVTIRSRATVVRYQLIRTLDEAKAYDARHIWNDEFIQMRLDYKPDRPLYVIELAVHPLADPLQFIETTEYAGCKSWVELS